MSKKSIIILCLFLLGISFLGTDIYPNIPEDSTENAVIPFQTRSLYRMPQNVGDPLVDSLTLYADLLGKNLNGVVLIARHDTILVEKAYGYLELFKSTKGYPYKTAAELISARDKSSNHMTTNTLFDLASISKQFTAAAILLLCRDGRISLNDSLGKYIPGTPYSRVTIKQMLSHNSGIPEYFNFNYTGYDTTPFITNDQLIRVLQRSSAQWNFRPGDNYHYCNTNYALLASIVAKVSEMPFEQFVRDNLWKPAGMKDTYFFTELVGLYPNGSQPAIHVTKGAEFVNVRVTENLTDNPISRGHFRGGSLAQYDRLNGILGDKGVYTTAEDLVRWTNAYFISYTILEKEYIEQATHMQNKTRKGIIPKDLYGYGLHLEDSRENGYLVYHGGLWNGYHNLWLHRPKDDIQIIFLSNLYNSSHSGQSKKFLSLIDRMVLPDTLS